MIHIDLDWRWTHRCYTCGDLLGQIGGKERDEGALKVVHSRSRIVLQQRICNGESNIGEPRSFAGVIQRERVGVIDKVGGVSGFESCFLEQRHRGSKIAVLQSFKGWLITHS